MSPKGSDGPRALADDSEQGARRGVIARAVLIAAVGLVIGTLGSGVAVILVHYAALFAIGTLFAAGIVIAAVAPAMAR